MMINSNEFLVTTFPIKPREKTVLGMYIAPTIMDVIGDVLNCKKIFAINLLNSYSDKGEYLSTFVNDVKSQRINFDELCVDKYNAAKLMEVILELLEFGIINEKQKKVYRCSCGKIDVIEQGISDFNIGKLYDHKNDELVCKQCGTKCVMYKEYVLCLELKPEIDDQMLITPTYLKNDLNHLSSTFRGNDILISKQRDTGYKLSVHDRDYNIDIDFIWLNFFRLFGEKNQIFIASNHQLYEMYIMNYLAKMSSDKNICFVATPYIETPINLDIESEYEKCSKELYKKLFILYNLKWRKKVCQWSSSIIEYVSTISDTRKANLYRVILDAAQKVDPDISLDKNLENLLYYDINMQKNIAMAKKLVRNETDDNN